MNVTTGKLTVLLDDRTGAVRDPVVHYDAQKVCSHRPGGSPLSPLRDQHRRHGLAPAYRGPYDDIEPTYSVGRHRLRVQPLQALGQLLAHQSGVLHRCDGDGKQIRAISATSSTTIRRGCCPTDACCISGRVVDRWVDYHHLWTTNRTARADGLFWQSSAGHADDRRQADPDSAGRAIFSPGLAARRRRHHRGRSAAGPTSRNADRSAAMRRTVTPGHCPTSCSSPRGRDRGRRRGETGTSTRDAGRGGRRAPVP